MCEYCEWQQNADEEKTIQKDGLPMSIYNVNILGVEGEDGENVSWAEINFCPMCGRDLLW